MAEVLPAFLSSAEVTELTALARAATTGWTPGRQHTGYDILPLRATMPKDSRFVARALARLGEPFEDYWDVYFIRYEDGAYIPPHTDPAQHDRHHRRINAVLTRAATGGELRVGGTAIALAIGDAVLFSPDREVHEVSKVGGPRLLFSVGAWI
jgi:Rps23 Pro-64 3,4-dihydroxylase Tpa1-like proline 4-hydroxylase